MSLKLFHIMKDVKLVSNISVQFYMQVLLHSEGGFPNMRTTHQTTLFTVRVPLKVLEHIDLSFTMS